MYFKLSLKKCLQNIYKILKSKKSIKKININSNQFLGSHIVKYKGGKRCSGTML